MCVSRRGFARLQGGPCKRRYTHMMWVRDVANEASDTIMMAVRDGIKGHSH